MKPQLLISLLCSSLLTPSVFAVDLIGQTISKSPLNVVAEISGVVESANFDSGEAVQQGQVIATVKTQDFDFAVAKQTANLQLAKADLQLKQSVYQRYVELRKKNSLSQNELDIANADFLSAKASLTLARIELENAQLDLKNTKIMSNISGFVVNRNTDNGAWVNQGDLLYKIVNIDTLTVRLLASEYDIDSLNVGQPIELWAEADPAKKFQATINRIGVEVDSQTMAYPVEVEINNTNQKLKPGMSIHASTTLSNIAVIQ